MLEYGLLLALVAIIVIGAVTLLGGTIATSYSSINAAAGDGGSGEGGGSGEPTATPEPTPPPSVYDEDFADGIAGFNGTHNTGPGSDGTSGFLAASGYQHMGDFPAEAGHRYTVELFVQGANCRWAISWWSAGGWIRNSTLGPITSYGSWTPQSASDVAPVGGTRLRFYFENNCSFDSINILDHGIPPAQPDLGGIYSQRFDGGLPTDGTAWGGTWNPAVGTGTAPGYLNSGEYPHMVHIPIETGHEYRVRVQALGSSCRAILSWWNPTSYHSLAPGSAAAASLAEWTELSHTGTAPSGPTHLRIYLTYPCGYDDLVIEDLTGATPPDEPVAGTEIYSTDFATDASGWNGTWSGGAGNGGDTGYMVGSGYRHQNPVAITPGNRYRISAYAKGASCVLGMAWWTTGGYNGMAGTKGPYAYGDWTLMTIEGTAPASGSTHMRMYIDYPCSFDDVVYEDLGTP